MKPSLVVLDGHTTNPGDLSWAPLEALAHCTIYDRTSPEDALARAGSADLILTNKVRLPASLIDGLPRLQYIGLLATGYDVVDVRAARERGIPVSNVPSYGTESVAQAAWALLLELTNRVGHHSRTVRQGAWAESPDFTYWHYPLIELHGLTIGIVGLGSIGSAVARLAGAFGMRVLVHTRTRPDPPPDGIELVDLDTLLRRSDVVSLHTPLTPDTHHLLDADRLRVMKKTALLINTSRGPLVDEAALCDALRAGRLAGAGLDVLEVEPPEADNPLYDLSNCIITPHCAWATRASRQRLLDTAVENVGAFLEGRPQNVVN